jgi:hypothetical protein
VQARPLNSTAWTHMGYVTSTGPSAQSLLPNTTYVWQVFTECGTKLSPASAQQQFTTLGVGSAPANDLVCNASLLTASSTCSSAPGTLVGATMTTFDFPCNDAPSADVWYKCAIPSSGKVTFRTIAGTLTDAVMTVYYGSTCNSTVYLGCEDDNSTAQQMPVITVTGPVGTMLWVRISGYDDQTGTFKICALNYQTADWGQPSQHDEGRVFHIENAEQTMPLNENSIVDWAAAAVKKLAKSTTSERNFGDSALSTARIFPNPATAQASLNYFLEQSGTVSIRVFDLTGRLVLEQHSEQEAGEQSTVLDLAGLSKGLYLVRFQSGEQVLTLKLEVTGK